MVQYSMAPWFDVSHFFAYPFLPKVYSSLPPVFVLPWAKNGVYSFTWLGKKSKQE